MKNATAHKYAAQNGRSVLRASSETAGNAVQIPAEIHRKIFFKMKLKSATHTIIFKKSSIKLSWILKLY